MKRVFTNFFFDIEIGLSADVMVSPTPVVVSSSFAGFSLVIPDENDRLFRMIRGESSALCLAAVTAAYIEAARPLVCGI